MMTRVPYAVVRWTHLPTGTAAQADGYGYGRNIRSRPQWANSMARKHLLAKLCRPVEPLRPVRSYHLNPPLGLEPYIAQGGARLATGRDAVNGFLAGRIPGPGVDS